MVKFGIGQPVARVEDQRLLTGKGQYTDDVVLEKAAHAYVLRSPYAHAELRKVDVEAAKAAPGVLLVLTGADVAAEGLGDMPCRAPVTNRDGTSRADTPRPILAKDRVRHVGDPIALVVAETLQQARDAAELIEVEFAELAAVTGTLAAAQPGAPQIWPHIKNNICFDWENGDKAAVEAAFAKADRVIGLEVVNNRVVVNSMEARAAVADYDPATDRSTLWTSTQGVHLIHAQIAEQVLKIGLDKLRIRTGDVGGGFGMKIFLYAEPCLVVWASRKLKRPVRWASERSEAFLTDSQGRDNVSRAEMAIDKDGHFLALRVTTHAAMGAYLSNMGPFIATAAGTNMLAGLYKTPAIYVNVKGVVSNTVPTDAYRGAGRPEAAYLLERLVDHIGRETGLGPAEIRRRNFIDSFPYTTPLGDTYDSGDFAGTMAKCMAKADWDGFEARRAEAKRRGRLRGIGLATYIERCGGGNPETAIVKFEDDDTVTVYMGNQSNGQGHETAYKQLMSAKLGIEVERIRIVQGDTDRTPPGLTGGSRALPVGGAAVLGVAEKIIEKGKQVAASLLEAAVVDIEFADGVFRIAGTDRGRSLFEVARAARDPAHLPEGATPGLDDEYQRVPEAATFPNGCHICELEIDPELGTVEIVRYTIVDDFGDVINPMMLVGQVHGGTVQGIGQALHEHTVYDEASGQLLSGTFMDYALPRAGDVPMFDFAMNNVRCTTNPLGVKGAGEAGAIGAPPAVINAIVDALHPVTGATHIDMPATPQAIWAALKRAA